MEKMRRAMKQTCIREKIFADNYERRIKMFNALVGSVALYGADEDGETKKGWRK